MIVFWRMTQNGNKNPGRSQMHIQGFKSVLESGLLLAPAARICWKFSGEKQATQNFVNDSLRSRCTATFHIFARFAYCKVCFHICQLSVQSIYCDQNLPLHQVGYFTTFSCLWLLQFWYIGTPVSQCHLPLAVQMLQTESKDGRSLFKESSLQGGLGILKGEDSLWWIHHHRMVQRVHPGRSSAVHEESKSWCKSRTARTDFSRSRPSWKSTPSVSRPAMPRSSAITSLGLIWLLPDVIKNPLVSGPLIEIRTIS